LETFLVLGVIALIAYSIYRSGKRAGSRGGYAAGRYRKRRRR